MTRKVDGLLMFSGGLDSTVAAHLLKSQGLSLLAVHYVLPFYSGLGMSHDRFRDAAEKLGIPLRIEEEGEEFLEMIRSPEFGFGKNANPCLDCRIHRLIAAKKIMDEVGAAFIATGEVIGQRPMSQRLACLHTVEKRTGLEGRLLRPLCAKQLPPTTAEMQGLVDREKLLSISGRSRQPQLAYAREFGLQHGAPAGGCILTNVASSQRYLKLAEQFPGFSLTDFKLIAYGRHFSLGDGCRLVIARDDAENAILEKIATADDILVDLADIPGPLGIIRGPCTEIHKQTAAAFVARYSKARGEMAVAVRIYRIHDAAGETVTVTPAQPQACENCRLETMERTEPV